MNITILGQTPSQKNGKQIVKNRSTGNMFIMSNNRVKTWQADAIEQLKAVDFKFNGRVQIDYMFYVKDRVQRDLDNMIASVNDVLQVANAEQAVQRGKMRPVKGTGIIKGDNWQLLKIGGADAEVDKENPRVVLTIIEIDS
jgi:Holliday junction resolvase RusA-like endonuclease